MFITGKLSKMDNKQVEIQQLLSTAQVTLAPPPPSPVKEAQVVESEVASLQVSLQTMSRSVSCLALC